MARPAHLRPAIASYLRPQDTRTLIQKLLKRKLGRRASFAMEFALVAPIFLAMFFIVFEVSYDEFMQEVLDNALQSAARQIQVGNTQGATSATFVNGFFCPYGNGLLNCNNLYVRVQSVSFGSGTCQNLDYYDATSNGGIPANGNALQLSGYYNGAGQQGTGGTASLSSCASSGTTAGAGYCTAGPQNLMLMSAIYVAPSFLGGLLPNHYTYLGKFVRPIYASAAFETENFATNSPTTPLC
jgi:hypothetical protein